MKSVCFVELQTKKINRFAAANHEIQHVVYISSRKGFSCSQY